MNKTHTAVHVTMMHVHLHRHRVRSAVGGVSESLICNLQQLCGLSL